MYWIVILIVILISVFIFASICLIVYWRVYPPKWFKNKNQISKTKEYLSPDNKDQQLKFHSQRLELIKKYSYPSCLFYLFQD